ncbi:cell division protein ZapA [Microvirga tunisiensis]|uniref:Cell division protein ZapA n=2 Tax=Pannonibacter tanglangensis TaxID=2750084 RepID=A0ABW9ZLT3_9HYPH|nr:MULTISPECIES: cell division protein ZapA [unclassified Pannonibacter]NBN65251.1 cell division protein ZapA [Pannonibacter sp. XCT-34]NBN79772.1 cell division protein ZapA [Pannonibacter sp. XCT-53]
MAQISVTINGRAFRMACDDGEEERLIGLAKRFDGCIEDLRRSFGEIGDQRLTVMAGIMVVDELTELEKRIRVLEQEVASARDARMAALEHLNRSEASVVARIDEAARRIEQLADGLTRSLRED